MKITTLEIAAEYIAAGISVIPVYLDGTKQPAGSWKQYQSRLARRDELVSWFPRFGIGIACGRVSGGIEVFDFDVESDDIFPAWRSKLSPAIRGKLCVIETGGGGYHVPFRSTDVCGNKKIAKSADDKETLIETRGQGGFIVAVGSPLEVHSSGNPYVQTHGAPLPVVPTFTAGERLELWNAARSFDRRRESVIVEAARAGKPRAERKSSLVLPALMKYVGDDNKAVLDFNLRASWREILIGWGEHPDGIHWGRPDKPADKSAKVLTAKTGAEVIVVFSRNAGGLSPIQGRRHRIWGKFGAFAAIHYPGNQDAALTAIVGKGYGQ